MTNRTNCPSTATVSTRRSTGNTRESDSLILKHDVLVTFLSLVGIP